MGISYDPFLSDKAGKAYLNFDVFDVLEGEGLKLGLFIEKYSKVICVAPSDRKVEIRHSGSENILETNLVAIMLPTPSAQSDQLQVIKDQSDSGTGLRSG